MKYDTPKLLAEMGRYYEGLLQGQQKETKATIQRLTDSLCKAGERVKGAEYDCGLLRAEIEALEAEIELCPDQDYHANPAGLSPMPHTQDYIHVDRNIFVRLITVEGQYSGYFKEDLEATMDADELKRWREWSRGITGAIHEGRFLVYQWDWDAFVAEMPNLD